MHGSSNLIETLQRHDLVDEYRLMIFPVVLGTGKRLFEPGAAPSALRLIDTKALSKGAILATYQPVGPPTHGEFQMEVGFGLPDA